MSLLLRTKRAQWLAICLGIVFVLACTVIQVNPATQIVEVTQVAPITQIVQSTQLVDITQVVPVTQTILSTRVVEVTRIVTVTQIVEPPTTARNPKEGIYFSVGDNLYRMNLDGSDIDIVTAGIGVSERLAVDLTHNRIYMSRWDAPAQILVFDLQIGENIRTFSDGPGYGGQGLAIDPIASKMYLGLYYNGVYVMDMDNIGTWTQLVNSESLSPLHGQRGQLQIDSARRHIYFRTAFNGDCGLCRYIWRVDFDGSNLTKIIPANGGDALALDLIEKKLYFSDVPGNGTVMRANLDGSEPETIFTIPAPYRVCRSIVLNLLHKKIYLSLYDGDNDYKGRAIARSNMDGTEFEILYEITGDTQEEVSGGIALFLP